MWRFGGDISCVAGYTSSFIRPQRGGTRIPLRWSTTIPQWSRDLSNGEYACNCICHILLAPFLPPLSPVSLIVLFCSLLLKLVLCRPHLQGS